MKEIREEEDTCNDRGDRGDDNDMEDEGYNYKLKTECLNKNLVYIKIWYYEISHFNSNFKSN